MSAVEWPCANFTEPVTCIDAGTSETARCDQCRARIERDPLARHLANVALDRNLQRARADAYERRERERDGVTADLLTKATHLAVRINEDCAAYLRTRIEKGETATEVVRQAIALHKFMSDGGLPRIQRAEQVIERARALIPNECWVLSSTADGPTCADMVGGGIPHGAKFTEDMCCLPCRLRAALAANTT